ncbi:DoxX family protein [Halothece sp. PCC 7418]|uniref:DoxX family protein n=1 Tax=Halothece sp. (strain PCC 7418) TaxID=65093 RepID=UPI0002A0874A|nr:DoxX family protein [Halothece sp. PCC 7418]AFZ45340.1 DoxX family protein [Halothece sp. PCC 7418]
MQSLVSALFRSNLTPNYWSQGSWVILRVVIGLFMIHNGIDKLADVESFAQAYVEVIGLPFPIFFSYVAGYVELIGAPLVALGLFTRPAALLNVATMAVALYHHVLVAGFSVPYLELASIYAAAFLFFAVNGGGIFSLDTFLGNWISDRAAPSQSEEAETVSVRDIAESKQVN